MTSQSDRAKTGIGARELLVLISAVMALVALGIDLLLPAFDDIRDAYDLAENSNQTGQLITVFFFGLAVAQFFYGPLADRFGRKPVLYIAIGIYIASAVASAVAPSFAWLLVARFVWGVGAAGARVVASAIIRDRFEGDAMAKAMSQIMAVFVLVPVFAPTLGAVIIAVLPWRALFWFCAIWAGGIALWSTRLRETLTPENVRPLSVSQSLRGYREVASTPITCGYTVATVFLQAVMTTYLSVSELVIGEIFDRPGQFPIIFGVVAAGFGIAAVINGRVVERLGIDTMVSIGFSITIPASALLVVVAVASDGHPPFWVFMPILAVLLATFMLLMPNLGTASMIPVGHIAGTASAFTGAVRMAIGAVLATIVTSMVTDSVIPFAVAVLLFCTCSAISVAIVRRRNGIVPRRHQATNETTANRIAVGKP